MPVESPFVSERHTIATSIARPCFSLPWSQLALSPPSLPLNTQRTGIHDPSIRYQIITSIPLHNTTTPPTHDATPPSPSRHRHHIPTHLLPHSHPPLRIQRPNLHPKRHAHLLLDLDNRGTNPNRIAQFRNLLPLRLPPRPPPRSATAKFESLRTPFIHISKQW